MWPIAVLVFACCFWGAYLLLGRVMGARLAVGERLAYYADASRVVPANDRSRSGSSPAEKLMDRLKLSHSIDQLLDEADVPVKPFEFVLISACCAVASGVVGIMLRRGGEVAASMVLVGAAAPFLWMLLRRLRRRDAFNRQIPDALQAISSSLRAGYGFSQGMAVVARDLPAPISVEFARAQREMNLGSTVEEALLSMARRTQSIDFDLAVNGILINRQVGGNLAELLDQITVTIRERVKLKNFIRVLTAQQRLSALVIMAVPPILLAVLLVTMRDYTKYLLITRVGHVMLGLSVCMQLLGVYFIRRIVSIDV